MLKQPHILENMIKHLFEANKSLLTQDDIDSIEDLIKHGESGIAFENLCDQLYEYDSRITKESYHLMAEVGQILNLKERKWLRFKELIL